MTIGIYKISFPDGRFYIGSSLRIRARIGSHGAELRKRMHKNLLMQAAYEQFGSFLSSTLLCCRKEDLWFYEQACIDHMHPDLNVSRIAGRVCWRPQTRKKLSETKKARGQRPSREAVANSLAMRASRGVSQETRKKMSASHQRNWDAGREHSAEALKKMSLAKLGTKASAETREKLSKSHFGKSNPHTPESRAKIAAAQTGKKYSLESREKMRASRFAYLERQRSAELAEVTLKNVRPKQLNYA